MSHLDWPESRLAEIIIFSVGFNRVRTSAWTFTGTLSTPNWLYFLTETTIWLLRTVWTFLRQNKCLSGIFYATTAGSHCEHAQDRQASNGQSDYQCISPCISRRKCSIIWLLKVMQTHKPFMRNRGSVLLVKKGNPKNISGVADLAQKNLRLFLSNPDTETVSYRGYVDTLQGMAAGEGIKLSFLADATGTGIVYGERIHHREAPQALADDRADVAIVYYHLALRYTRIFPALFEIVPLGGTALDPRPVSENIISKTHAGIIGDGGSWGAEFLRFLSSDTVSDIYAYHGLLRAD